MIIKNYTGRNIVISDGVNNVASIIQHGPAPKVTVLNASLFPIDFVTPEGEGFHSNLFLRKEYRVTGLPEEEQGTMFIVPPLVLKVCGDERVDLISINEYRPGIYDGPEVYNFKRTF